ncbi:MAG TPA: DUF3830 family protein [Methylomirabilota bacterium]|nr:DUF3830 family protein [Methylomirabilota bacterium]
MARRIEIELDGVVVTARLLEERAPRTCEAMWHALPYEDRVTHAKWSGAMFHTNTPVLLGTWDGRYPHGIEGRCAFQAPGEMVYYEPAKEFAVAYGEAQFSWQTGPIFVTPVAVIEDDLTAFARKGEELVWKGAKRFVIRRRPDGT